MEEKGEEEGEGGRKSRIKKEGGRKRPVTRLFTALNAICSGKLFSSENDQV